MKRRTFIKTGTTSALAMALPIMPTYPSMLAETRFGAAEATFMLRRYRNLESLKYPSYKDQLEMIAHFSALGFKGAQLTMYGLDAQLAKRIKKSREALDFFLEGQIRLPKNETELQRFEQEVIETKAMDVTVIRTVCLSGRRYEDFKTLNDFQVFKTNSIKSLQLAEPIMRKHQMKLAVENHKDWRADEFLEILKQIESEWIGVTLDTGNNLALLEDPMKVVQKLAPYAFSVHLKDMAISDYEDGFLMSEVNLGEGFLDLQGMIDEIRRHNPDVRFNLEMITRDPLKIPCLTQAYWATFDKVTATELAIFLKDIKRHKSVNALPTVSDQPADQQLALEIANNQTSVNYAKDHFGFR